MNKLILSIIYFFSFILTYYVAATFALPYAYAIYRGASIVSHTSGIYDDVNRVACVNGNSILYFSNYDKQGYPVIKIKKHDKEISLTINKGSHVHWCGSKSGGSPIVISWDEYFTSNNSVEHVLYKYAYKDNEITEKKYELPYIGTDILHIKDFNNDWLLSEIVGSEGGSGIFLLSLTSGMPLIPTIGTKMDYRAGLLFNDGFLYTSNSNTNVLYYSLGDKENQVLGEASSVYATPYTRFNNNVAWHTKYAGGWRVVGYDMDNNTGWSLDGMLPFLMNGKVIRIVVESGHESIVVSNIDGTERKELLVGSDIGRVAYYDGRLYWEEKFPNVLMPLHLAYNLIFDYDTGNKIVLDYSYLFSKEISLSL